MTDFSSLIPRDKFDVSSVEKAARVGFPDLNPILSELLEWLQDPNWPIFTSMAQLLRQADDEIIPHIKRVLEGEDGIWKHSIQQSLLLEMDTKILAQLKFELQNLVDNPSKNDVDEDAHSLAILVLRRC